MIDRRRRRERGGMERRRAVESQEVGTRMEEEKRAGK